MTGQRHGSKKAEPARRRAVGGGRAGGEGEWRWEDELPLALTQRLSIAPQAVQNDRDAAGRDRSDR